MKGSSNSNDILNRKIISVSDWEDLDTRHRDTKPKGKLKELSKDYKQQRVYSIFHKHARRQSMILRCQLNRTFFYSH